MDIAVLMQMAKGATPALIAGLLACVAIAFARKGRPAGDETAGWLMPLMLGVGCTAGMVWVNGGEWKPGQGGATWLPTMAVVAALAGLARGEREHAPVAAAAVRAVALAAVAWMTVRSLAGVSVPSRWAIVIGTALVGSVLSAMLERTVKDYGAQVARWPSVAAGWLVAFAASQVLVIGLTVQTAAWMAAGVSALFGVCLALGLVTRRAMAGRGVLCAAGVLLCGLFVHGWQYGEASDKPWEIVAMGSLLGLSAAGPAIAAKALGVRGRGWIGVAACAVPAVAAVAVAAILRPPPLNE